VSNFAIASLNENRYTAILDKVWRKHPFCKWQRAKGLVLSIWQYLVLAKLTDPLPTEQKKRENAVEIGPDWTVEKRENEGSTSFRQAFRIEVRLLFSTKRVWGVGIWLMDAGRGSQKRLPKMPKSPKLPKLKVRTRKLKSASAKCYCIHS
jgi:hypothetical protein